MILEPSAITGVAVKCDSIHLGPNVNIFWNEIFADSNSATREGEEMHFKSSDVKFIAALSTKSLCSTAAVSDASMVTMPVDSLEAASMNDHE